MPAGNPFLGYAFLRINFAAQKAKNPLELTIPLVQRGLKNWKGRYISFDELQRRIASIWGLTIPQNVIRFLMPTLRDRGIVFFDPSTKSWAPIPNVIADKTIEERERAAREMYQRVLSRIKTQIMREPALNMDPEEVLERFLDAGALSMFGSTVLPIHADKLDDATLRVVVKTLGLVGDHDEQAVQDITDLVIGDILYKAVTAISECESVDDVPAFDKPMQKVNLYLDTGLLFRLLGYFGRERQKQVEEVVEMARQTGCRLNVFPHTVDEVQEGLQAVAGRLYTGSGAYGPIVTYAVEEGVDPGDLAEMAAEVPAQMAALSIDIREVPQVTRELSIDEKLLEWQVEIDVKQDNPIARVRDVDSLAAVFRLRRGQPKSTLESCEALFVTTNKSLAHASDRYFRRWFGEQRQKNVAQICVTDVVLASRLWLKLPTRFKDVPRMQVVTHALSNLRPPGDVLERFKAYIARLVVEKRLPELQAARLQLSRFANQVLAIEAQGDAKHFDDEACESALAKLIEHEKRLRRSLLESTRKQQEAAREEVEYYAARLTEKEEQILRYYSDSDQMKEELVALRRENEDLRAAKRMGAVAAEKMVSIITRGTLALVIFAVILAAIKSTAPHMVANVGWANSMAMDIVIILSSIFLAVLGAVGLSHISFVRRLQGRIQPLFEELFRKLLMSYMGR